MPDPVLPERPKLAPGVRLHHDKTRNAWVLLSPERVIEAEGPASEILRRCDGKHTVAEIIDELAVVFVADRAVIAQDVRDMMTDMAARHLLA
jgi:pyrroloquinoline quinone biosynthesis protein D